MWLSNLRHQEWENSRSFLRLSHFVTIHEDILPSAMAMHITVKCQWSLLRHLRNQILGVENRWMKHLTGVLPSSIQVASSQTTPVVSIDDSIWIHHGNNLEHKLVSKLDSFWVITDQELNDSLHHK